MESKSENNGAIKKTFSFKKEERLTSKKVIDKLFSEGSSFLSFPLKVIFSETSLPSKYPVQAAFSVGKRNFKLAVRRNLIKRKMRESYRLNKFQLYNALTDKQMAVFFIFIGKEIPKYEQINTAMKKGIKKLIAEIS
ncbi:MAG: ribonuclease P protein component [Draconibacterium sp.]|nr:ribonuclease P protein component [Draconibacterium sp.]